MKEIYKKIFKSMIPLAVAAGILFLPSYRIFDMEMIVRDLLVRISYMSSTHYPLNDKKIVTILIDDETRRRHSELDNKETRFDERTYLAKVLTRLAKLPKGKRPSVIGVNYLLESYSSNPLVDKMLVNSITDVDKNNISIVLASRLLVWKRDLKPSLPLHSFLSRDNVLTGHVNFLRSEIDGSVRQMTYGIIPYGMDNVRWFHKNQRTDEVQQYIMNNDGENTYAWYPSFSRRIYDFKDAPLITNYTRQQINKRYWLEFLLPYDLQFDVYSAFQVLSNDTNVNFEGRIVLIGSGLSDSVTREKTALSVRNTIVSGLWEMRSVIREDLPSTFIHAYAIDTFRLHYENKQAKQGSLFLILLITIILYLGLIIYALKSKRYILTALTSVFIPVLYTTISIFLFINKVIELPVVKPIALWFVLYGLTSLFALKIMKSSDPKNTTWRL